MGGYLESIGNSRFVFTMTFWPPVVQDSDSHRDISALLDGLELRNRWWSCLTRARGDNLVFESGI